jgi:hypothetical protein
VSEQPKTIEDVLALLQSQTEAAQETSRVQAEQAKLRQVWGEQFQQNFDKVATYIMELPPEQQALYNNAEGAQFLKWQLDQQGATDSPPSIQSSSVPSQGEANTGNSGLRRSDLLALTHEEYVSRLPEVMQAYREGAVEKDVPMGW